MVVISGLPSVLIPQEAESDKCFHLLRYCFTLCLYDESHIVYSLFKIKSIRLLENLLFYECDEETKSSMVWLIFQWMQTFCGKYKIPATYTQLRSHSSLDRQREIQFVQNKAASVLCGRVKVITCTDSFIPPMHLQ